MIDFQPPRRDDVGIDMTPMIDCVFQLLIFFMLSSSFLTPSVRMELPRTAADRSDPVEAVIVTLDATAQLFIDKEPVTLDALRGRLAAALAQRKERVVMLRADKALSYEKVLEALVAIQQAGTTRIHLAYQDSGQAP